MKDLNQEQLSLLLIGECRQIFKEWEDSDKDLERCRVAGRLLKLKFVTRV